MISSVPNHELFLQAALKEAVKAGQKGEVPVGAVVVLNGKIIARAHNLRETKQNALGHAELLAIAKACKKVGSWRLEHCIIYVSLEPCPMCAGALSQARVKAVYYGAKDLKGGAVSLLFGIHDSRTLNHRYTMTLIETPECGRILSDFFKRKRTK